MSKERCQATKQLMKQALGIMQSGSAGQGRGISLAITYLEDAYLRIDFHMREQGWAEDTAKVAALPPKPIPVNAPSPAQVSLPRVNNLRPAANIPQLSTGIGGSVLAQTDAETKKELRRNARSQDDVLDDLSVLE